MRSALFSFLSRFDAAIRILERKYPPKKNKSDNKQQTQNEITWPEADRFPPISYRIPKFKKDEEEEEVLLLLVQVSLLDSTQLNL